MNSQLLDYMHSHYGQRSEFEGNRAKFLDFFEQLKEVDADSNTERTQTIYRLFNDFVFAVREDVFDEYDPRREAKARAMADALMLTGDKLEKLLNELKDKEFEAAAASDNAEIAMEQNLPSARFYLELVDETSDLVDSLLQYVSGSSLAKENFQTDARDFSEYFNRLIPLKRSPRDIEMLETVDALYRQVRDGAMEIFEVYDPATKTRALKAIDKQDRVVSELKFTLRNISEKSTDLTFMAIDDLNTHSKENQLYLYAVLIGTVVLGAIVVWVAKVSVADPINRIAHQMMRLADGDTNLDISSSPRRDEVGSMEVALRVFLDSELKRRKAEEQLTAAKEKAEADSLARLSFLGTMSHEIRTPLNGIVGMIDLFDRNQVDDQHGDMLDAVRESARILQEIINEILDFSKLDSGHSILSREPIDLVKTVENAVYSLQTAAVHADVKLQLLIHPTVRRFVVADPLRIRQILCNLVGNAIKFTRGSERGCVRIYLRNTLPAEADRDNKDQTRVQFEVVDNGIGMKESEVERLFEPFEQVAENRDVFGGTGLGLAIAKALVDLKGGSIDVESVLGEGATFRVELPMQHSPVGLERSVVPVSVVAYAETDLVKEALGYSLRSGRVVTTWVEQQEMMDELSVGTPLNPATVLLIAFDSDRDMSRMIAAVASSSARIVYTAAKPIPKLKGRRFLPCWPLRPTRLLELLVQEVNHVAVPSAGEHLVPGEDQPQGARILIAEDNPINRQVMELQVARLKCTGVLVESGADALEVLQEQTFDMMITDCEMPGMSGYELAKIIRSRERGTNQHLPIIAATAHALEGERGRCLSAGMDDYISKPFDLTAFGNLISKWVNGSRNQNELLGVSLPSKVVYVIENYFSGNYGVYLATVESYLKEIPVCLECLSDVDEERIDIPALRVLSHNFATSSRLIGETELGNQFTILERLCNLELNDTTRGPISAHCQEIRNDLAQAQKRVERIVGLFQQRKSLNQPVAE